MPDFIERRRLARLIDAASDRFRRHATPGKGWAASLRRALGMSAEQVAARKGVSRNAIYQAERNELEGSISLRQMESLARAMGGRFVYAIVLDDRVEAVKYAQALRTARAELDALEDAASWPATERQDWTEDRAAELLHDMPASFWDHRP